MKHIRITSALTSLLLCGGRLVALTEYQRDLSVPLITVSLLIQPKSRHYRRDFSLSRNMIQAIKNE